MIRSLVRTYHEKFDDVGASLSGFALPGKHRIRALKCQLAKHRVLPWIGCVTYVIVAQGGPSLMTVELGVIASDKVNYVVVRQRDDDTC